ncbi:MAG: hypothetical protein K2P94_04475 [Rhodospirillaceae bacterium]|nr:hypothetical protein [Rhodospirillaceae bacterium]
MLTVDAGPLIHRQAPVIRLFNAGETLFRAGWFIESLAMQVLVVFAIRTRRPLFSSRPQLFLGSLAVGIVILGIALPFTPIGRWLGFVTPPGLFFVYLAAATAAYLGLVEVTKRTMRRYAMAAKDTAETGGPRHHEA